MNGARSPRMFDVPASDTDLFEEVDLARRTNFQSRAPRSGADFKQMAIDRLRDAGGTIERARFQIEDIPVDAQVHGDNGRSFLVLARGVPDESGRPGLRRPDTVEKVGFFAMQLARCQATPILLITSDLPDRTTKTARYLAKLSPDVWDVIAYRHDVRGFLRLRKALNEAVDPHPPRAPWREAGPWTDTELTGQLAIPLPESGHKDDADRLSM